MNKAAIREERTILTESDHDFVQSIDTMWIGSYAPNAGADINHQGEAPGFIRVTSDSSIEMARIQGQ